jgi:hypothetical protein
VRIDGHREGGAHVIFVPLRHVREFELVGALRGNWHANQATRMHSHKIDHLGRDVRSRANQIAFVLAVFIIGYDDEFALANVLYGVFDAIKRHGFLCVS